MPTPTIETERPPRSAAEIGEALRATTPARPENFAPGMLRGLPDPARRWLEHAIPASALLARRATLRMHGQIRVGPHWHPFRATQILVPTVGFVWSARTRIAGLPVSGFDGYANGIGAMRWRLLGLPIVRQSGDGTTRSAIDRLAAESVLLPSSLIDADWRHTAELHTATYAREVAGLFSRSPVTITVAADGRLLSLTMQRWGNPAGGEYDLQPFVVSFDREFDAGPLLVPDGIRASWPQAGGEFFRASLDAVRFD